MRPQLIDSTPRQTATMPRGPYGQAGNVSTAEIALIRDNSLAAFTLLVLVYCYNMYFQREYHCVLLLVLTLCAAVVTSQLSQACTEARAALLADQVCLAATNDAESVLTRGAAISNEALDNFCSSNCRALNNRLATACANQVSNY